MIGKTISHYKILERLGGGGMGVVYKAEDTKLRRFVALKFLQPELTEDESSKKRFLQEARSASALDHPSICTIHEIDETEEGHVFIVMAFIEGETLKERLKRGPLPLDEALVIGTQVAEGLGKAHEQGVVHRDIKPANVMLTEEGGVRIVDFGLARLAGTARITESGSTVGTAAYMSPEQSRSRDVDHRTDVWSLGVVLYEMIAGRLPFRGEYGAAVIHSVLNDDPQPASELRGEVSPELERIVHTCLEKDPGKRYGKAAELRAELEREKRRLESGEEVTAEIRAAREKFRPTRLRRLALPFAGLVVLLLAILFAPAAWQALQRWLGGAAIPEEKHLAVLPFTNIGGDPANQALCDGLMETLCSQLSAMEQFQDSLWVVPAREVVELGITSPGEARRALGVSLVVTGSVQLSDARARLTLNLVDADSMRQLRSQVISERLRDVAALHDETAVRLARMLEVELPPQVRSVLVAGGSEHPDAYGHYLEGRGYLLHYQDEENVDRAILSFERAIEEDPGFALAHAGLAEACYRKFRASRDVAWADRAVEHSGRAAELDDSLAAVRNTLGLAYTATGRYEEAAQEFQRALESDPVNADAYRGLARAYRFLGDLGEAETTYRRSIELRPDYWAGYHDLGAFYLRSGRYAEAAEQFLEVMELTPGNTKACNNLGMAYYNLGRAAEAIEILERSIEIRPNRIAFNSLGTIYYYEGRYADAARMMERAMEWEDHSDFRAWGNLASVYMLVPEERERTLAFYRRAAELAEEERELNPNDPEVLALLAGYRVDIRELLDELGEHAQAREEQNAAIQLTRLLRQMSAEIADIEVMLSAAENCERLGQRQEALRWLEAALEGGLPQARVERIPYFDDLRQDEGYLELLRSIDVRP